jgi:alpha-L-fucosidase
MKTLRLLGTCAALVFSSLSASAQQNFSEVKPAPYQVEWQDMEFGVIIHFSTNTFLDREWGDGTADPKVFNPTAFDPDQWMRAIKASGAKYVVMVAKHHDGFVLWPTNNTDYNIKKSPWKDGKGDLVGDVARAARRVGLGFGVYLSPWDRHDPRYKNSAEYDKYYLAGLTELATRYGPLVEFWLDGAGSEGHVYDFKTIIEHLRTYQPNTVVFADTSLFEYGDARWGGTESGFLPDETWNVIDRHGVLRWRPAEADTPLRKLHWFWHPNDEASLKSVDSLMRVYEGSVGHNGQLMLGLAPDRRGLLPEVDVARLKEFGEEIQKRYGKDKNLVAKHLPVDAESAKALDGDDSTFWTAKDTHSGMLEVRFPKSELIDNAVTMEWLNDGQRVQGYAIDAWVDGKWKTVAENRVIGHKRIDSFAPVTTGRVRLRILSSTSNAVIREFQLFHTGVTAGQKTTSGE